MDLKITVAWLKRRAELDENAEVSAGHPNVDLLIQEANARRQTPGEQLILGEAFGKLVQFMRGVRRLSLDDLARSADVEPDELAKIENTSDYRPEPRTVYQLAKVLRLPEKKMLELSGNMVVRDSEFTYQAERFAANAKHIDRLTGDQRDALMAFVQYLAQSK
jgi:transcriptional regulator with XRE-family HTH domain